ESSSPAALTAATARSSPTAPTWSRHGEMARISARAQASTMERRSPCLRTVAVLIDRKRWSREKSRMAEAAAAAGEAVRFMLSPFHAVRREHVAHTPDREGRIAQQARRIGEPEELGEMQRRAGALLAADHGEMVLPAVEVGHED